MTDIYSLSQPLTDATSQILSSNLFQSIREWGGRSFSHLKNVAEIAHQNPSAAMATIVATNLIFFTFIHSIKNYFNQSEDEKKAVIFNVAFVGGSISAFNLLLSKMINYSLSPWFLATINIAAIAATTLLDLTEEQEEEIKDISQTKEIENPLEEIEQIKKIVANQEELVNELKGLKEKVRKLKEKFKENKIAKDEHQKSLSKGTAELKKEDFSEEEETVSYFNPKIILTETEESMEEKTKTPKTSPQKTPRKLGAPTTLFDLVKQYGKTPIPTSQQKKKRLISIHATPSRSSRFSRAGFSPIPFSLDGKLSKTLSKDNLSTPPRTPKKESRACLEERSGEISETESIEASEVEFSKKDSLMTSKSFFDQMIDEVKEVIDQEFSYVNFSEENKKAFDEILKKLNEDVFFSIQKEDSKIAIATIQAAFETVLFKKLKEKKVKDLVITFQDDLPATPLRKAPQKDLKEKTNPFEWSKSVRSNTLEKLKDEAYVVSYYSKKSYEENKENIITKEEVDYYEESTKKSKVMQKVIQDEDNFISTTLPQCFYEFKDKEDKKYLLTVWSMHNLRFSKLQIRFADETSSYYSRKLKELVETLEPLLNPGDQESTLESEESLN